MAGIQALDAQFGHPGRISFEMSLLGGPVAILEGAGHRVTVALRGAHVLAWSAPGGRDVLWLSPEARLDGTKAVRGGIPVCWPWFGDHPTDASKPAHGFVRTRIWRVIRTSADERETHLVLGLDVRDEPQWPHAAEVLLMISLGAGLSVSLATRNLGPSSFDLTEALHTYFRVDDVRDVSIGGLDGQAYLDKLDGYARKVQSGAISFEGEVDRIYLGDTSRISVLGASARKRLDIVSDGSCSAVVWNPWAEKTMRLGDMGAPDAYRHMICVETANAGDDIVSLKPGATHTLRAHYSLGN